MLRIVLQSLNNRKNVLILIYISLSLSVLLFLGVERTKEISKNSFSRTISGTDLIIGARTGQVNLILYSVFHIGNAVNNMSYESFQELSEQKDVAWAIPLSLGDSYKGFRVVATTTDYFQHYKYGDNLTLELAEGETFSFPFDTVLGASVARELHHKIGDSIVISHGAGNYALTKHDNLPFTIKGILKPTGTPVDNSVFIPLEGMTGIHIGWETGIKMRDVSLEQALASDLTPHDITSALIGLKSRGKAFQYQRLVSNYEREPLMAILPGAALFELWNLISTADKALSGIAAAVVLIGMVSLLSAQLAVLNQRRREMALLRSLGATPRQLFNILFLESFSMTAAGSLSGLILLYGLQFILAPVLQSYGFYVKPDFPSPTEWYLLLTVLVSGVITGLIPAFSVYRKSLTDGITIRS